MIIPEKCWKCKYLRDYGAGKLTHEEFKIQCEKCSKKRPKSKWGRSY